MDGDWLMQWQEWVAFLIVAAAATFLFRQLVMRKKGSSCGSGKGCSGSEETTKVDNFQV